MAVQARSHSASFLDVALRFGTDKVTNASVVPTGMHAYHELYAPHLEPLRQQPVKLLEIGLGCQMAYGPGASMHLWRTFFPVGEVWFADLDDKCVAQYKQQLAEANVSVVVGDQADILTLRRWVDETGGCFDIIVDDGGHKNEMIWNSFQTLYPAALRPGGLYFLEDLHMGIWPPFHSEAPVVARVIADWMQQLTLIGLRGYLGPMHTKHPLPPRVKWIQCMQGMCVIKKCADSDLHCPVAKPDPTVRVSEPPGLKKKPKKPHH